MVVKYNMTISQVQKKKKYETENKEYTEFINNNSLLKSAVYIQF